MRVPSPFTTRTTPSATPLQGPSGAGGTPEAFGAGIGRGMAALATGVGALASYVKEQDQAKRRFQTLREFTAFQTQVDEELAELKRNMNPAQNNFAEQVAALYQNREAEFLNRVDPEFQGEISVRTAQVGQGIYTSALEYEYTANDTFFKQGIADEYESARVALGQSGSVENLEIQRNRLMEKLDAAGISEAEKIALSRQYMRGLESVSYKAEYVRELMEQDESGGAQQRAMGVMEDWSTAGQEELGVQARVAEAAAVQALGSVDIWAAMPARARAAVISLVSGTGELPQVVEAAIKSGDLNEVAEAIRGLGGERRTQEADLVLDPGAQIDDDPRFDNVPYEDRLALRADAEREVTAMRTSEQKAAQERESELVNELLVGLYDGQFGQADIDSAREQGWLRDIGDIERAQKLLDTADSNLKLVQQGLQMIQGGMTFDPTSTDHKDVLNALVGEEGLDALDAKDAEFAANTLIPLVRHSRDIPTDVAGMLTGMIRSNDEEKALWALDLLAQLQQASPKAYDHRITEDVAADVEFWRTRKDSVAPSELLSSIRGGLTQAERQQRTFLRTEAKELLRDNSLNLSGNIIDYFDTNGGWWGGQANRSIVPYAAAAFEADFQTAFMDEYERYGDPQQAKDAAITRMQKTWGVTQVGNQNKLMKFPPELAGYPAIGGNYDWMEGQLRSEGVLEPEDNFELIADADTEAEVDRFRAGGEPPSYLVVRVRDGVYEMVTDENTGLPIRQFFSITDELRADEAEWRTSQDAMVLNDEADSVFGKALQHSIETGTPIPQELSEAYDERNPWNTVTGTRASALTQEAVISEQDASRINLSPIEHTFLGALTLAENNGIGGTALKLYNDVIQRGRTEPITEQDLTSEEHTALRDLVLKNAAGKTSGRIDYKDYGDSSFDENILGGFSYQIEDGIITIEDTYDFNANRADGSEDNIFVQALAVVAARRNLAASIGRKKLSDLDGKGVPVKISLRNI